MELPLGKRERGRPVRGSGAELVLSLCLTQRVKWRLREERGRTRRDSGQLLRKLSLLVPKPPIIVYRPLPCPLQYSRFAPYRVDSPRSCPMLSSDPLTYPGLALRAAAGGAGPRRAPPAGRTAGCDGMAAARRCAQRGAGSAGACCSRGAGAARGWRAAPLRAFGAWLRVPHRVQRPYIVNADGEGTRRNVVCLQPGLLSFADASSELVCMRSSYDARLGELGRAERCITGP